MKTSSKLFYARIVAIALALSFGLSAYAEETPPREDLRHALHLLERADREYGGHRAKAVAELQATSRDLGINLGGELPEREGRWKSDEQLREARRLIISAREKMDRKERDKVGERLDRAVHEVDEALNVR
jgi:hypothetical protein